MTAESAKKSGKKILLEVIKIIFRMMQDARGSGRESIVLTWPRTQARIEYRRTLPGLRIDDASRPVLP